MPLRRLAGLPRARGERRLVLALSGTTVLLWVGGSAILPLLPSYLRQHGSSPGLVGLIMSAYFAASVLSQYPVGRLSDRVGRRPVVLGGLLVFCGGSVGFALAVAPGWALCFRALQGVGAGAVTVAAAAAIGTLVAQEERGGAFGLLYGSQMLALALGPLVGSILGASSMKALFLVAAVSSLAAAGPVLAVLPGGRGTLPPEAGGPAAPGQARGGAGGLLADPAVLGVLLVFAAAGLFGGVYESCWTLLLRLRHARSYEIGLSWTLFALPFAALSVPAGRLANRLDRRALGIGALVSTAAFCVTYPFLRSVPLLVGLGCLEAVGAVMGAPPALLVLTERTRADQQGAAQGAVETARTAATAAAAAASGALFGLDPVLPFALAAGLGLVAALLVLRCWRQVGRPPQASPARGALTLAAEWGSAAPESPARGGGGTGGAHD